MANIELPGKGMVRAYNTGAEGSMAAAAAPWQALGGVGRELQGLGEKAADFIVKQQELNLQRQAADMELEFDELRNNYEIEILQNPNITTQQAVEGWERIATPFREKYQRDDMSPMEQDMIGFRSKELVERGKLSIARSSVLAGMQRHKQAAINLVKRGEETGNDEMRSRGFEMLSGVVPDADLEAERMNSDRRVNLSRVEIEISDNPYEWKEKLKSPQIAMDEGISVSDIPILRNKADSAYNQSIRDFSDTVLDLMSNELIRIPEEVDAQARGRNIPPRIIERLKAELKNRGDAEIKDLRASPEYQAETVGRVSVMLADYKVEADGFDQNYDEIATLIQSLPPGSPAKKQLSEMLEKSKAGQLREFETAADAARAQFTNTFKDKLFGVRRQKQTLGTALDDGFLRNPKRLTSLGFSEEQAKEIIGDDKNLDPAEDRGRVARFRTLWKDRKGEVTADPYALSIAQAIRDSKGRTHLVEYEDPAEKIRAERALGQALIEFERWVKANPDKVNDEEAIDKKVHKIIAPRGEEKFREAVMPPLPGMEPGFGGSSDALLPPR